MDAIQAKASDARTAAKIYNKFENEYRDKKRIENSERRHYEKMAKKRLRENALFVDYYNDGEKWNRNNKQIENSKRRHYEKMAKIKKAEIKKLKRNLNEAEEYILNMYKYTYIVEDVCDRFECDQLTYESTMDIIDTIDNRILLEDLK